MRRLFTVLTRREIALDFSTVYRFNLTQHHSDSQRSAVKMAVYFQALIYKIFLSGIQGFFVPFFSMAY